MKTPTRGRDFTAAGDYNARMATTTLPDAETDTRTKQLPPYAVILHDDDFNDMAFVAGVLQKVFGYALVKCVTLMLEAHKTGRSVVWVGPLEVAEFKADQIHACGPDPHNAKAKPLRVTVEPVG